MPTIVCHHCSEIFTVEGPKPDLCPSCGKTLHIEGDPTPTGPALHSTIIHFGNRNPTSFGRYIVQSRLGAGGFGTVFLAKDPQLDRLVAIKVPRGETGRSPLGLERFAREARSIAQLRHENIVSVFDVELDGEPPFIVCEYVNGETLSDRMRKVPLPLREAAKLIAVVARAADYAHERSIIHRDIKPSNIMIDSGGKLLLMDFGLAKREDVDHTMTSDHAILGTPAYMSPEQAWGGKRGAVDRRSDVYSLGTVLYQLLTRELPFRGEPRMVLRQLIEDDPKSPRKLNAEIHADLETICEKAMQKQPADRYQTARALAEDLENWLANKPIGAKPPTRLGRGWRWCRRNPTAAGLICAVLLLLLTWGVGSSVLAAVAVNGRKEAVGRQQAEKQAREVAETGRNEAVAAEKREADLRKGEAASREKAEKALRENRELLSRAYVEKGTQYHRAPQFSDDYNPLKALAWLGEAMKQDANNTERLLAGRIRLQTQMDLAPHLERMWFFKGEIRSSGVSPKRDTFFIAGADGTVNIWRIAEDGPSIASLPHPAAVGGAAYSPDGKRLATICEDGLRVWEVKSGKSLKGPLVAREPHGKMRVASSRPGNRIVFDRTGDYLLAAMRDGLNQIWDSRTGEPIGAPIIYPATFASFADSGRLVVLFGADRAIHAHDARSGAEKYVLRVEKHPHQGKPEIYVTAMVSPDGGKIAILCVSGDVILCKATTGEKIGQIAAAESYIHSAAFSPDGKLLATGTVVGTARVCGVDDGHSLWRQNVMSGDIDRLKFSPDGTTLAVGDSAKRICVLSIQTGAMIAPPISNDSPLACAEWGDSAGRFLTVDVDGVARLWNLNNNLPVTRLPHTHEILLATISNDRRVLATTEGAGAVCLLKLAADGRPDADGMKLIPVGDLNIDAIALNADGSQFAISGEHQVSIWDTRDAKKRIGPLMHGEAVKLMRFTPDGVLLVCVANDGRATVWDVAAGTHLYEPLDVSQGLKDLDIDGDGNRCAVAAIRGVTIWDLKTGIRVRPGFFAEANPSIARFVNDPRIMLVASWLTGRIKVWDVATGQPVRTFAGRTKLQSLVLSDDKRLYLAGYGDGTARLSTSVDGAPASPPFNNTSAVRAATMDQSVRWIATVTEDAGVLLWDAQTGELLATFRTRDLEPTLLRRARLSSSIPLVFFSANNRYLHIVASQGFLTTIELDPTRQRQNRVADEIALSSGAEFDGTGGLRIVEPSELAARWKSAGRRSTAKKPDSSTKQTPNTLETVGSASVSRNAR